MPELDADDVLPVIDADAAACCDCDCEPCPPDCC